jgi:non-specific serine/threonine protein kinase
MHYFQGRHVPAAEAAAEALSLGRDAGDTWAVSFALFLQALAAFELGDFQQAHARAMEARDAGGSDAATQGGPLMILANVALVDADHDRAQQLLDDSIEVHRDAGEKWGLGILLSIAAGLRIVREDFAQARAHASEAMALCEELEDPRGLAWALEVFAGLLAAGGHVDGAARVWGAADGLLESVGGSLVPTIGWIRERYIDPARTSLGDAMFEVVRVEGHGMSPAQAIAFAREQALRLH